MNRSLSRLALTLVSALLAGTAVAFAVLVHVLLPTLGVGDVQRIVELGRHLDQPRQHGPYIVFLGNSITMEGIDTAMVRSTAKRPGRIENLALSGCGTNEQRVLLPKLLGSRPNIVVLAFGPTVLDTRDDLPLDKAYAFAMSGFPQAWPASYQRRDFPDFDQTTFDALHSSPFRQTLHFRTAPLNWLNGTLRLRMRSDLRGDATADWIRPYRMLGTVSEKTLAWHLESLRANLETCCREGQQRAIPNVRSLVATAGRGGAKPVLVVLPIHPRLRDDAAPLLPPLNQLLAYLAKQQQGIVVDASDLLTEEQFADAVHPNADGRAVYSRFVGTYLSVNE